MSVKIIIPKYLQNKANRETTAEVKGRTVYECIEALIRQCPGLKGEILNSEGVILIKWMLSINDEISDSSDELSRPVEDGDVIVFIPMIAGG